MFGSLYGLPQPPATGSNDDHTDTAERFDVLQVESSIHHVGSGPVRLLLLLSYARLAVWEDLCAGGLQLEEYSNLQSHSDVQKLLVQRARSSKVYRCNFGMCVFCKTIIIARLYVRHCDKGKVDCHVQINDTDKGLAQLLFCFWTFREYLALSNI